MEDVLNFSVLFVVIWVVVAVSVDDDVGCPRVFELDRKWGMIKLLVNADDEFGIDQKRVSGMTGCW